jgi:hypothetical protein
MEEKNTELGIQKAFLFFGRMVKKSFGMRH